MGDSNMPGMAPKAGGVVGLVLIRDLAETLQLGQPLVLLVPWIPWRVDL